MASILNRLEIDVMQTNELLDAITLTMQYRLPSIVVHNNLVSDAIRLRGRHNGKFKIITTIDYPKGETFGVQKFRGLISGALEADGYEVVLTNVNDQNSTKNEVFAITNFILTHIGRNIEVRFVLNALVNKIEDIQVMCNGLIGVRTPALIRTDSQLKLQVSKANPQIHNNIINTILPIVRIPIKLSGNISSIKIINECPDASRYAVSLLQANSIINNFFSITAT